MNNKTDRNIAVSILMDVLEAGAYANIALRKGLAESNIDSRSRAFVTDLVNETLRNLIRIDSYLNKFSKTPVVEMKPFIRNLLRVSVCQIKFMDRVPDRAAVNEAVVLVKTHGFENLSGFVNAVLRNVSRDVANEAESPHIAYSYPKWLWDKLCQWLGEEDARKFCVNSHKPPPVIVYANTCKITPGDLAAQFEAEEIDATPLENGFFMLRQTGDITRLPSFKDGLFYVLDPGTKYAVDAMAVEPGQTVLDLCAAPGGKAFAMAIAMKNEGSILACDIHPHRVELINQTRKRLGLSNITTAVKDATVFDPTLAQTADAVLLDVPCTGFGTIRKHPEVKYSRRAQDIAELASLQRKMLAVAAKYVKPGGRLVYCTCTVATEENGDNIEHFLKTHENFNLISAQQIMPQATSDGFYVAVLHADKK